MFNETEMIGLMIGEFTNNIAGSLFITLLLLMIFLFVMCLLFRIPIEWASLILFPFLMYITSVDGQFLPVLGIVAIFFGIIMAKYYILNDR